jgi:ABC-type sugar transport system ATPase subunit
MSLLQIEGVSKSYHRGARVALDDSSLSIDAGEMVVVWGERMSGRSTLLRIAAGIETPDSGSVHLNGRSLCSTGVEQHQGISFCRKEFRGTWGQRVIDEVFAARLARPATSSAEALKDTCEALRTVGAQDCAALATSGLKTEEVVLVAIARALTSAPSILVIDEPTAGVDPLRRDEILRLLRKLCDRGMAVLATTGEGIGFLGADRVLSLESGRLRGAYVPELAPVTDLLLHRRAHG